MQYEPKEVEAPLRVVPSRQVAAAAQETEISTEVVLLDRIRTFWVFCLRHKLLLIFGGLVGAASAVYWLDSKQPIYRAEAKVIIQEKAPRVLSNVKEVVELGSGRGYQSALRFYESQYRFIQSSEVAEMVIDRMNLWNSEHLLGLDSPGNTLTAEEKRERLASANLAKVLANRVEVSPLKKTMIVGIAFSDPDPEFAIAVSNSVAEAYRDHNLNVKRRVVQDATRELKTLMDEWEQKYQAANQAIRAYESEHDLGTIPNSRKTNDERLATLSAELTRTRIDRIQAQSRVATLRRYKKLKNLGDIQAAELLRDPLLQQLKTQLAQLEADLAGLQSSYLEQHPKILELTQRRDSLHKSARQHITNLVKSVTKELKRVRKVESGLEKELEQARLSDRSIANIERGYEVLAEEEKQSQTQFEEIRNRYVETTMSVQVETNNVRVLETATSARVIWPRRRMVMAFAVGLALIIALILSGLLEYADSTIKSWEELQERMGLKVLGVLPVIEEEEEEEEQVGSDGEIVRRRFRDMFIHENRRSHVAEAFRAVRTNLLFMSTTRPLNSLMITSADPSEGKSTIAINTSVAMAISGSKVLLVEADMRRPRLRKTFGLDGERGLTTCLAGTGSIAEDVQHSDVENLHVLPCGPLPPNPAELLHTERFMTVKAEMESVYDIVIFDSPPVNPVADALVLGGKVDACLLVVRAHRTSRHALQNALRQLQDVGIPILGSVLNHREVPKNSYKYRGQGYGYGYGYGYSYGKGEGYGYESLEEEEVS